MKHVMVGFAFLMTIALTACGGGDISQSTAPQLDPGPYVFEKLAGPEIWTDLNNTIAVDSSDNIYVTSGTTVFRVEEGLAEIYLSREDILAALGPAVFGGLDIGGLDVGPDDRVYLLEKNSRKIMISDGPGSVVIHRDISDIFGFPHLFGVVDSDNIFLINLYDGLWSIKSTGNNLLYDDSLVSGGNNCGSESLSIGRNGRFAYIPGCSSTPLLEGSLDGTGVGILATENDLYSLEQDGFVLDNFFSFSSIGRDSEGGYLLSFGSQLAKITEDGSIHFLPIKSDLFTLGSELESNALAFYQRPIVKGISGKIYICSRTTIYVANRENVPL